MKNMKRKLVTGAAFMLIGLFIKPESAEAYENLKNASAQIATGDLELTPVITPVPGAEDLIPGYSLIIYDANGGTGAPESQQVSRGPMGDTFIVSEVKPVRENYNFMGWSDSKDGEVNYCPGKSYRYISTMGDVTLYAVWKKVTDTPVVEPTTPSTKPTTSTTGPTTPATELSQPATSSPVPSTELAQPSGKVNSLAVQSVNNGKKTITRKYKKNQKFSLGVKVSGKATYKSSNKKVIAVDKKGKAQIKGYGKATVTIKQKGKKAQKVYITIIPSGVSVSASSPKAGILSIRWKRNKSVNGYQIQYSVDADFTGNATKTGKAGSNRTTNTSIRVNSGTVYYVRVRTYKKGSGGTVYSAWSAAKSIHVK